MTEPQDDGTFGVSTDFGGFRVSVTFAPTSAHIRTMEPTEIAITRLDPATRLTGKAVRELPLGKLLGLLKEHAEGDRAEKIAAGNAVEFADVSPGGVHSALARFEYGPRGRGHRRTDWEYAMLAERYVELVKNGDSSPASTLADEYGGTARAWTNRISEARKRDLLTPTTRGRVGGELTERASRILTDD